MLKPVEVTNDLRVSAKKRGTLAASTVPCSCLTTIKSRGRAGLEEASQSWFPGPRSELVSTGAELKMGQMQEEPDA